MGEFTVQPLTDLGGNVALLLNHSCEENLVIVPVYTDIHDATLPQLAFFALCDVPPGAEINVNYGSGYISERLGGKCLCGTSMCPNRDALRAGAASARASEGGESS